MLMQVWLDVKHQIKDKIIFFRLIDYEIVVSWSPVPTSLSFLSSFISYQHKHFNTSIWKMQGKQIS